MKFWRNLPVINDRFYVSRVAKVKKILLQGNHQPATRHQRKKKAADNYYTFNYSDQMAPTSRSRVQLFRPILPSTEVHRSTQDEMIKKRVLPRETFPKPPKTYSCKVIELLCSCTGLNKQEVRM